jgi:hypothetical protein
MSERFLGLSLIFLGVLLILVGLTIYLIPKITELKDNPLIILPLKKNGFFIGFSPLLFLILLIVYVLFHMRYS